MSTERQIVTVLNRLTSSAVESADTTTRGRALNELRRTILSPNVVGVGVAEKQASGRGQGKLALCIYVRQKLPRARLNAIESVPHSVHPALTQAQILTDVVELGPLALDTANKSKPSAAGQRPVQPGGSIGHYKMTAGTVGAVVKRKGKYELLSNSHVLALSGKAALGDPVLAPGRADGGRRPGNIVGNLVRFQKFVVGGEFVNLADCALASFAPNGDIQLESEVRILDKPPSGVGAATRGMKITKVGRTTSQTYGTVRDVHFRFVLSYAGVGKVGFLDQVLCTRYSDGGDSGSLVLERSSLRAVGLHFASAPQGSVFNPLREVLRTLGAKLVTTHIR